MCIAWVIKIRRMRMGGACSMFGGEEHCIDGFEE
jgi:hypothetical protein